MGRPLPPGLDLALIDPRIDPALVGLVKNQLGSATRVSGVTAEILKRRVVRYTLDLAGKHSGPLHLVGKVYESRVALERGLAALRWLWGQGFPARAPYEVTLPRVLGCLPEFSLLVMEQAGGRSLQRLLKSGEAVAEHVQLFARALVKLHGSPAAYGPPATLDDHLARRCAGLCGPLARAFPELAEPIQRIVDTARRAERDEQHATCLQHGDYHPGQVHIDGERLWLVDLDPLGHGDPAYDVAMALVGLKRLEDRPESGRSLSSLRAVFLSGYFARTDLSIAERVPLAAALIFLKRACKRFRWQDEEGWEDAVRLQVRRAEECLDWLDGLWPPRDLDEVVELCERCPDVD